MAWFPTVYDPNVETSKNPLDSTSSTCDSTSSSVSNVYVDDFDKFDDEGMVMIQQDEVANLISDWLTTGDESPVNLAMLPIGTIISVEGKQVIVEGKEKTNNLLSKGCFLWITETRDPLGYVNDIFGNVNNPFYTVRLESPRSQVSQGTQVSLIVEDFVQQDSNKGCVAADSSIELPQVVTFAAKAEPKSTETDQKNVYQHPMAKQRGIMPTPLPAPAPAPSPAWMTQKYKPRHLRSGQYNTNKQPYGLPQHPYQNAAAPWPVRTSNPFPSPQVLPKPQPQMQPSEAQSMNAGPVSSQGEKLRHRGAGTGFNRALGRGRGLVQ